MVVRSFHFVVLCALALNSAAQEADSVLPAVTVYSPRVANQSPVATFAMPVSALRFEPRVDLQSRNFAESQADVTIRGGIFENTGFSVGAVSLFDPQTGHYFAEIPIAPAMLGAPEILTGADLAFHATNATAGSVAYQWRRIQTQGSATVGGGQFGLLEGEFYQGYSSVLGNGGRTLGADVAWAHSDANGSIPYGDHVLNRFNARIQVAGRDAQTDFFVGYQDKFFGWPNMYTPFNSNESEDIQTLLIALNHRVDRGAGDYFEAGAYYRRNDDDYAFNRFAPVGPVHPFQHTTWVKGAAASARVSAGETSVNVRGEILADDLRSTSLTFGRYHTRVITKLALVPERSWSTANGATVRLKAGATYDDTDRGSGVVSPVFEISRERASSAVNRIYFSYAQSTQVPTYTALNSNAAAGLFRGNPFLQRETSRNVELGVSGTWEGWSVQAAAFRREDDHLVDWTFRRGVTARSANAVDITTAGVELVARRSWSNIDLVVGYTWLTKDPDYLGATVDASFYALNYARHRLTAALVARITPSVEVRLDNEVRFQAANFLRTTGGNDAVTSSLGVSLRPPSWHRVRLTLQVDNLWDTNFQQVPAVPASRRQFSAVVGYSW
ncbi:MAG: TonB-dependent receptor [Opitutus sp.]